MNKPVSPFRKFIIIYNEEIKEKVKEKNDIVLQDEKEIEINSLEKENVTGLYL